MSKTTLERFKKLLLALRARHRGDASVLADEAATPAGTSQDPADQGSEHYEKEFTLSLLEKEGDVLAEIEDALARVAAGTYGGCEGCRRPIPRERLEHLPYTRYCVHCARRLEG
jgi:DnaK suppressor protein